MYFLRKPPAERVARFIAAQRAASFSYANLGATSGTPPAGYVVDHSRVRLGSGESTFASARSALARWTMFDLGWVELLPACAPIEAGTDVAVLARVMRLWSLNGCRIVHGIDERGATERFGFAYGTLADHAESGEERFLVEWRHADDSVWYDILAFSRPHQWPTKLARSFTRRLQRRFARDSLVAMQRAVRPNSD